MKKASKRFPRKIRVIVLLFIIALPLLYVGRRAHLLMSYQREEKQLQKEISILEAEHEMLRARISDYKRGSLIEAKARDELGMIKKGERVYIVPKR